MQEKRKMRPKRSMQGEIVEVEGGRIIRALGRKDRHSKVCTAKGPKDRRVRLSANTAIRFYDVQDRLGYDRPSLAIDWLMNEAKSAIDALSGDQFLPAMKSIPSTIGVSQYLHQGSQELEDCTNVPNRNYQTSSFTSFFNNYPEMAENLNPRSASFFSINSTQLDFEGVEEMVHFQRMVTWNSNPSSSYGNESAQGFDMDISSQGYIGNYSDQNHALCTQREPLQSSYLPPSQASIPAPNTSFGIEFPNDGFLGFSFPKPSQGQEEDHKSLIPNQISSASSLQHYQD